MALTPPRNPEIADEEIERPPRARPIGPVWLGAALGVVGVAILVLALGVLLPALLSGGSSTPSAGEIRLRELQTQEALAPRPTAAPTQAVPTPAPTTQSAAFPASAPAPTPAPTLAAPTAMPTVQPAAEPTPASTVSATSSIRPELEQDVAQAYLRYFQVSAEALRTLNPIGLDSVASGEELDFLKKRIEEDRAAGKALDTNVQHSFVVLSVRGDEAQVADVYRDSSVYIDLATGQPLAGSTRPTSTGGAPEVRELYHLRREISPDGASNWKVEKVERYA
jgi:hypothetical protein